MTDSSLMDVEPNIVKAQFIITNNRIYTLEFDQNIEFRELKEMIRVAAHLKKIISDYFVRGMNILNAMKKLLNPYFPIKI